MKIGILTYHRAHNYGAILQAIAIRVYLQELGHEVYYVDYWPDYHKEMYKVFSWSTFKKFGIGGKIYYLRRIITKYGTIKQRINSFENAISKYISPYCKPTEFPYDLVVIGSDQLWRKQSICGYDPVYFGKNNINTTKQITYAVSMGLMPKDSAEKKIIKKMLRNIHAISVREHDLFELVHELGYQCEVNVDPTFLLTQQMWEEIVPSKEISEKYVLYYNFQRGAFCDEEIYRFARKKKLKVKMILGGVPQKRNEDAIPVANIDDFISLIKNAEYVFTSSFHGLAFSLIFNKQFYASYLRNSNRAKTLLETLGIENRILQNKVEIPELSRIDYSEINPKIQELRELSNKYLNHNLG